LPDLSWSRYAEHPARRAEPAAQRAVAPLTFTLLLPIFLLAGLGALLARLRWLRPGWHLGVTELTAKFLIPALLFTSTYRTGIPASLSWQVLGAFYLPLVVLFAAARLLVRPRQSGAATALAATYSNTVFVGIPVLVQALGSASLQFAYPVIAFHSLVCFSLYHLTDERGGAGWVAPIVNALTNPIVVALLLGLALNLAGLALPQALTGPLDILGSATLPCALLALGASVASLKLQRWAAACAVALAKLVVLPLAVMALAVFAFDLPRAAASVLVVLASCPVGINAAFVVTASGDDARLVNSSILLSSLACAATIPAWLWLLKAAA
jgi:predicted permease